jgi:hypothetical protein
VLCFVCVGLQVGCEGQAATHESCLAMIIKPDHQEMMIN